MKFVLKYGFISIMSANSKVAFIHDLLHKEIYKDQEWRRKFPLLSDILCMCLEYITEEKKEYYENGRSLFRHEFLVDGKSHGKIEMFNPDGSMYRLDTYAMGVLHGESVQWHTNGQIVRHRIFVNNRIHGKEKCFTSDGHCYEEGQYITEEIWERKGWYPNGIPAFVKYYKNNLPHGEWSEWNNDGTCKTFKWLNLNDNGIVK